MSQQGAKAWCSKCNRLHIQGYKIYDEHILGLGSASSSVSDIPDVDDDNELDADEQEEIETINRELLDEFPGRLRTALEDTEDNLADGVSLLDHYGWTAYNAKVEGEIDFAAENPELATMYSLIEDIPSYSNVFNFANTLSADDRKAMGDAVADNIMRELMNDRHSLGDRNNFMLGPGNREFRDVSDIGGDDNLPTEREVAERIRPTLYSPAGAVAAYRAAQLHIGQGGAIVTVTPQNLDDISQTHGDDPVAMANAIADATGITDERDIDRIADAIRLDRNAAGGGILSGSDTVSVAYNLTANSWHKVANALTHTPAEDLSLQVQPGKGILSLGEDTHIDLIGPAHPKLHHRSGVVEDFGGYTPTDDLSNPATVTEIDTSGRLF